VRTPTDECAGFAEHLPHSLLERSEWSWKGGLALLASDDEGKDHSDVLKIKRSINITIDFTKDESEWQQVVFIEK